jgi:hypothetical protein
MKKKFTHTERRGLPGGPNEYVTHISGLFSVEGYKSDSPDKDNPFNLIDSGNITMEGVEFPVMGIDNLGNAEMMLPQNNYEFPGDMVLEVPMAQTGIEVPKRKGVRRNPDGSVSTHLMATETLDGNNWFSFPTLFQDPDGTWIDMSNKPWKEAYEEAKRRGELIDFGTNKEAAIKFGEGSWKPKMQEGKEKPRATISQYEEPAWYEKAADYLASPMTALSYIVQGKDLPDRLPINVENRNAYDMVIDMINPAAWYAYAESADRNIAEGNYTNAAFDALGAIPVVPAYLSQGKNVVKGGKNVIKNVARSADEVVAGSDDIVKARLDYVEEVNPLSQTQAENLVEQGRNAELLKSFEEGANTIDDFVKSYSGDLSSPEGFKRLVEQEADYLRSIGMDEARIGYQAEVNAGARLNEIINISNKNRAIAQGERSTGSIIKDKYNFNNASYSPNTSGTEFIDDLFYKPGMDLSFFHLNKTKIGAKVLPGETNLGTMFNNSRAVAAHEIGGHGLQSGRRLPVDSRLKNLEPLDEMTEGTAEAYKYFMKGSGGKEPSAYLHELRQAMLDANLIKNRYQYVSPDQLKRFQTLFDIIPSGTMNTMAGKYHSNTRILDFMKPTKANFDLLSRELNKLPAMAPIGIGLGGAAALSQEKYGGEALKNPNFQEGREVPPEKWQDTINYIDQQKLKRAIAQAESLNGELMKNPYSTASGLYGQRFSELEKGKLYEGTRDEFIKDLDAQNKIFDMRLNEGVKVNKTTPLLKDAFDLMNEYKPQIKDFDFDYYDIISLSNFLGRQGTREFFGNVIRDGKDLSDVFPNLYGPNVKQPNKTPQEYLGITRKYYRQYAGEIPVVAQDNTRVNMPIVPMYDMKPAPTSRYSDLLFTEDDFEMTGDGEGRAFNPFDGIPIDTLEIKRDNTNVIDTNIVPDSLLKYENLKGPDFSDEEFENILFDVSQKAEFNEYQDPVLIADFIKKSNFYAEGWKDMTTASPDEVKDLQDVLVRKGYDVGPTGVDGKYGPKTYAAHRAMVDDVNLNPNSISRYYKKYGANNASEVRGIQEKLVKLGYMSEKLTNKNTTSIDGKFGDQTREALERYNTENTKDDPKATVFNDIPNLLEEDRCAAGMCVILERNNVLTEAIGVKYKDAWDLYESMENADNSEMVYNIYDDPRFKRINEETDINDLKKITRNVKKESQTKASDYAIGDIVGLFWDGSSHHAETLKSKTYNTHSGFVSDIVDGVPIITHNVNGRVLQQPYDQLTTAWIRRPNEDVEVRSKYNETAVAEADAEVPNYNAINNLQLRYNTQFEGDRLNEVESIFKRAKYNSHKIPEILNSDVDQDWLESATVAITGVESGIGFNAPRTIEEARDDYFGLKGIAYDIKDKKEEEISLGIGKTKFASLDKFAREYFDINNPKDLADDTKAVDAISYTLTKNYELFKDYAEQYPSLGLTEEDIRNMAVLAYNQGSNRLINTGRVDDNRSPEEEVEALRSLYNATLADRSSTNYRFLPEIVYDVALATGIEEKSPSYINKVNTYINDLYPTQVADAGSNLNNQPPRILAKGGEYGIYKNYIEGLYDDTDKIQFAEHVYDKLNRRHYKQAKNAAMAAPNFIMTNIIKNS